MEITQNCKYCGVEFTPKRRRVQKFCSNSCRSLKHRNKKRIENKTNLIEKSSETKDTLKLDKMSIAGVGNAAAGTAVVEIAKAFFTPKKNQAATKGDLEELMLNLKGRYFLAKNIPRDTQGRIAYYDLKTGNVIYQ